MRGPIWSIKNIFHTKIDRTVIKIIFIVQISNNLSSNPVTLESDMYT